MGTAVLTDGNRYCLQQKHAKLTVMQQDAIQHFLVTANFRISTYICGKVVGYQKGTTDGYSAFLYKTYPSKAIDGPYVDGVSLTYGSPRKHLFTYACGVSSDVGVHPSNCPCARGPGANPPSFVQDNYYCESGNIGHAKHGTVYTSDPLWDGKGCNAGITVAVHRLACHGSIEMS